MEVKVLAPAKINLSLDVLSKRADGYHNISTVMQAVDLYDTITITDNESATVTISCNCEGVPCDDSNICAKAAYKFFDYCKTDVKGIHIDIDKKIPTQAGLAGGSSDGAAVIYSDSGFGESTTDMVFSGQNIISENASLLAESKRFTTGIIYADIDVRKLSAERRKTNTFTKSDDNNFTSVYFDMPIKHTELIREFSQTPFIPSNKSDLDARCEEIITMQATGLATRLAHTGIQNAVLGLSGGLDSTLALIVCVHAFDMLGIDRKNIHTVTMPCFGTTKRTKSNAQLLAEAYGVSFEDINITKAVRQHFADINHDESVTNITYENSQARERTQILMDLSNKYNGLVIGTGDLSELALGWATYNGDHMSMYAVNVSIPKTLVRYLTAYEAQHSEGVLKTVLLDVLDTPVSPELLPPDKNGEIAQKTEDVVGPYELHDFFLYYLVRFGFEPNKIYYLAKKSFAGKYDNATIKKWLTTFVRRFFTQQFKRSCLPDGPKVGSVTLSPRSDWRMPSDACVNLWLENLEED